jgi:hypothetical protein
MYIRLEMMRELVKAEKIEIHFREKKWLSRRSQLLDRKKRARN